MVTSSERDFLWETYAADRRARLNLGIRRRLCAAAGARPAAYRADELPAAVDARHAGDLLRRRDRHGRQHPSRRPRRRAHADAVVARPQRRLLACRSVAAGAAADHGSALRLRGGQRRSAGRRSAFAAELDAPHDRGPPAIPGVRPRHVPAAVSEEPQGPGLSARVRGTHDPLRRQSGAHAAGGGTRPVGIQRPRADRAGRRLGISADRPADLSADAAAVWLLLVPTWREEAGWPSTHTPAPEPMPEYQTIVVRHAWRMRCLPRAPSWSARCCQPISPSAAGSR